MRRARIAFLLLAGALLAPAAAHAAGTVSVVARGIDNPRQIALSTDGTTLYVAAAGRAGTKCVDKKKETCFGTTSRVLSVNTATGAKNNVAKGFMSVGSIDGSFATGLDGVAVGPDGSVFAVETSATPKDLKGTPKYAQDQVGRLFQVFPSPTAALARIDEFEWSHNSDGVKGDRNSNPYALLALDGHQVVADAGANAILDVRSGTVSLLSVIPKIGKAQAVPTAIALGPDGDYYVGALALEAGSKKAKVFKVPAAGGAPTVVADGLTAITGLAVGADGTLFVTQLTKSVKTFSPNSAVIKVAPDGTRTELGTGQLHFPAGAALSADATTLYVSNYSTLPSKTPKKSPFRGAGGQIVKITGF
jgi:sugar lactone lactonase YvrE